MDWKEYYKSRIVSAEEAASHIKSGDRIGMVHATGAPERILAAMTARHEQLRDVEIMHGLSYAKAQFLDYPESFYSNSMFTGPNYRKAMNKGHGYIVPRHFSLIPRQHRYLGVDVSTILVSPPNENGYVNFGCNIDNMRSLIENAKLVVAEVNPKVPIMFGETWAHVTEIDYFVESDDELIAVPQGRPGDTEKAIASHVAEYIKDGDCLQLGIGGVPDAIMGYLVDKNDLGIHSEMISDGVMKLTKSGNINGKRKNFYPNKICWSFAGGTKECYEWMNMNPMLVGMEIEYLNNPYVIGLNDNMVSINGGVCCDLLGQICSDSMPGRWISGAGGQNDFVVGAARSNGGRSFIVMPATAQDGKVSRINVNVNLEGYPVMNSQYDVDMVATEYGVAKLKGKHYSYRRDALIAIAAPQFRDQLREESKQINKFVKL